MTFQELELIEPLQRALAAAQYQHPTPIQRQAIPPLLQGRDLLGCAQTGTGKTAAFLLPMIQHLLARPRTAPRRIRGLVLAPTRELAAQILENLEIYAQFTPLKGLCIFGGVNQTRQVDALKGGIDILVATPGRLLDLMGQGYIDLGAVEFFVLDEADRMLDMGFIHDIRKVLRVLPVQRQNMLFSATLPAPIVQLASFLRDPVRVEVTPQSSTVERIDQEVMFVEQSLKRRHLVHLIRSLNVDRAIVFTRTKHGANRLVAQLEQYGHPAAAIHGNKSQGARTRALEGFKTGEIPILVATDLASRGLDVDGVSHVFNYDLPNEPESYVHRIGRTGRAGQAGVAISFCDASERDYLRDIERTIRQRIPERPTPNDLPEPPVVRSSVVVPDERDPSDGFGRGGRGGRGGRPQQQGARPASGGSSQARPAQQGGGPPRRDAQGPSAGPRPGSAPAAQPQRSATPAPPRPAAPVQARPPQASAGGSSSGAPAGEGSGAPRRNRRRRRGGASGNASGTPA